MEESKGKGSGLSGTDEETLLATSPPRDSVDPSVPSQPLAQPLTPLAHPNPEITKQQSLQADGNGAYPVGVARVATKVPADVHSTRVRVGGLQRVRAWWNAMKPYRNYTTVGVLCLINLLNYMDRFTIPGSPSHIHFTTSHFPFTFLLHFLFTFSLHFLFTFSLHFLFTFSLHFLLHIFPSFFTSHFPVFTSITFDALRPSMPRGPHL